MLKWKWNQAMFDMISCLILMNVHSELHFCCHLYSMFKLIWKKAWGLIDFVCKYNEEDCSSRGELTDVIKYAALCRITGLASSRPQEFTLPSIICEVWTNEDACPKFAYLVLRNARRPNVTSPDYLPNLLGTLDCDGNADSSRSSGKKVPWTYCSR